jgi:hypothetical protein
VGPAALSRGEHNGEDFYYRLQVRQPRPDFHFYVNASNLNIPRGSRVPFSVAVERLDDFAGEIAVELAEPLPPGFRFDAAPILGDQYRAILTVAAGAETESTPLGRTFRLLGKATIAGKEITREGRLGMLRVTGNPDLVIGLHPQGEQGPLRELKLEPGGTAAMVVRAVRQNGFAGRIPIEIPNLPHGVVVMNTGLNDILIPEHEEARVVELHAEPWVRPLRRTIYAIGRTETTSPLPTQFASEPAVLVIGDAPAVAAQPEF